MDIVTQLIDNNQLDILTLNKAQLDQDTPAQAVTIPWYKLFTDILHTQGLTARTVTWYDDDICQVAV